MALAGIIPQNHQKKFYLRENFLLILVGIMLIAVGTYRSASDQEKTEKSLLDATQKNGELSAKLAEDTEKSLVYITGGDGFVYLLPQISGDDQNKLNFFVSSKGKFPLYDVSINISDSDLFEELEKNLPKWNTTEGISYDRIEILKVVNKSSFEYDLGNLVPGKGKFLSRGFDLNFNNLSARRFNILLFARNGWANQKITFKKIDDKWTYAFRVARGEDELHRYVAPGYPRREDGSVDW